MTQTNSRYVILDTDAFSYLYGRRPQAADYSKLLAGKVPVLAFVTLAEVRFGALSAGWGPRRTTELEESLRKFCCCHSPASWRRCGPG